MALSRGVNRQDLIRRERLARSRIPSWPGLDPLSLVPISFKYGAEALALVGVAYGLIKWVGRSLRSVISDTTAEQGRLEALGAAAPHAAATAADLLVRQGLVSATQLSRMTPREREFLLATAGRQLRATPRSTAATPSPPRPSPLPATPQRPTPSAAAPVRGLAPPSGPRLHLITPSRPPLGVAVHCPGCGTPLDRDALQRVGSASCGRCKRPVSAHIQRGRLTVIIEETADEAEYRRRMESR